MPSDRLVSVYEEALQDASRAARQTIGAIVVFAMALGMVGVLRQSEMRRLNEERSTLASRIGERWTELEVAYTRSFDVMEVYAREVSTPWAQVYLILTASTVFMKSALEANGKDNPVIAATLTRISGVGNRLSDYNSDIRIIASAQRRGVAFANLSRGELLALWRILAFRLSDVEEKQLNETYKAALVVLELSRRANDPRLLLPMEGSSASDVLKAFSTPRTFRYASTAIMMQDLRSLGKHDTKALGFRALEREIQHLPSASLGALHARIGEIDRRREQLTRDPGISIPSVGISVSAPDVSLASLGANCVLLVALWYATARAIYVVARHRQLTKSDDQYYAVVLSWFTAGRGLIGRIGWFLVLCSPSLIAAIAFRGEVSESWRIGLMAVVGVLTAAMAIRVSGLIPRLRSTDALGVLAETT